MKFEINEQNCVKFTDTTGITWDIFTQILRQFNHLGYGLPDENFVKEYLDKHTFLQPDQSRAILILFGKMHRTETYSKERIESDNQKAKDYFGTTPYFRLAGYILTDGSMLNLSYDNHMRDKDHREISQVIDVADNDSQSAGLIQFVNYGNIRLLTTGFELCKPPTEKQRRILAQYIRKTPELYVHISNTDGQVVKEFSYDFATPSKVLSDIDTYFSQILI